jgi:hypothetical protein
LLLGTRLFIVYLGTLVGGVSPSIQLEPRLHTFDDQARLFEMAWFALSLRSPKELWWTKDTQDSTPQIDYRRQQKHPQNSGKMYNSQAAANIYTLRIFEPTLRPNLLATLRAAIAEGGGTVVGDLVGKGGFMYVSRLRY